MSASLRYLHPQIREHLASQYVLGTLSGRSRRRFEALLLQHPELETDVYHWQQKMNPINDHTAPSEPPARVWHNLQTLFEPQPAESLWLRLWGGLPLWRAGFALALMLSLTLWLLPTNDSVQPVSYMAVMQSTPAQTESPMVISAYQGDAPGRSHLHIQWNKRMQVGDIDDLTLWAISRKDGSWQSLGALQRASGTRLLSKPEWLALADSAELAAVRGDRPDGEVVYRGPCLQLSAWQSEQG